MTSNDLIEFLARHNMNYKQFADIIGVTHQAAYHWVVATRSVSKTVSRLCKLFDKKPELIKEF